MSNGDGVPVTKKELQEGRTTVKGPHRGNWESSLVLWEGKRVDPKLRVHDGEQGDRPNEDNRQIKNPGQEG